MLSNVKNEIPGDQLILPGKLQVPVYFSVEYNAFSNKCVKCHSESASAKTVLGTVSSFCISSERSSVTLFPIGEYGQGLT